MHQKSAEITSVTKDPYFWFSKPRLGYKTSGCQNTGGEGQHFCLTEVFSIPASPPLTSPESACFSKSKDLLKILSTVDYHHGSQREITLI